MNPLNPYKTATAARAGQKDIQRQLQGAAETVPIGDLHDDGTGLFPNLEPSGEKRVQQTKAPVELLPGRVQLNYEIALRRDCMHIRATRGRLLLHGWQSALLLAHKVGRELEFARL